MMVRTNPPSLLLRLLFVVLLVSNWSLAENIIYPSAPDKIIDITKPPYSAVGNGTTDCTNALQKAMNDWTGKSAVLYFPNGTYLVSNTLTWHNTNTDNSQAWGFTYIQGQSRDGAVIKLKSNTFTNSNSPKEIIVCRGFGSADWFNNYVQNITFNVGTGNPGAIGLAFYTNNTGAIRDVKIISEDNQGVIGLDLDADMNGPMLVKNLVVQGFQRGIMCAGSVNSQTFEHITLTNQSVCCFDNGGQSVSIRDLTTNGTAKAVNQSGGMLTLVTANLVGTGSASTKTAVTTAGLFHARSITTSGYQKAITHQGGDFPGANGPNVSEFFSRNPTSPFASPAASLNLTVREAPDVPWDDPATWANVNDFGADPTGNNDSRAAIQAAIESGATTIWFPGSYACNSAVTIRKNVRRLIGTGGFVDYNGDTGLDFIFADGTSPTVVMEHIGIMSGGLQITTSRNIVIRSCMPDHIIQTNNSGNLFIEDACPSSLTLKGNVWARQLNPEIQGTHILNDAGTLWILGLKTERGGTILETTNGGLSEVLGNFSYTTTAGTLAPMFVNNQSSVFAMFNEVCYSGDPFTTLIRETRDLETKTVARAQGWISPYIGYKARPVKNNGAPTSAAQPAVKELWARVSSAAGSLAISGIKPGTRRISLYRIDGTCLADVALQNQDVQRVIRVPLSGIGTAVHVVREESADGIRCALARL